MVWAGIVAFLRDRFNANEILVSLMLVYVATLLLGYMVYGPWKDPKGYNFPQTKTFEAVTQIPRLFKGSRVSIGLVDRAGRRGRRCGCSCSARGPASPSRSAGWRRRPRATRASRRGARCGSRC